MDIYILDAVDSLFDSRGWCVSKLVEDKSTNKSNNKSNNTSSHQPYYRSYYRKYFELDRFEISSYSNAMYECTVPLKEVGYTVVIEKEKIYDFMYEHIQKF
jgi:hypothetical protein